MTSALILAAGMGTRLMPLTKDRPKTLVDVAGRPLLGGIIHACAAAGVDEVVVVTGCLHEHIDRWLAHESQPLPVRTVFNAKFDELGNAWSVAVAREMLEGADFVKLDGDLVLDPEILAGLCRHERSALALDTRAELDEEAMKASADGGLVTGLGKWIASADASGESIGVERIANTDAPAIFDALEKIVETRPNAYYEDAYHQLIIDGELELAVHDIGTARWTEIDCAADLDRARSMFAPA
jgi:choline kinase